MNDKPVQLITNKTDKDLAADHRDKIIKASGPFIDAMSDALKDNFRCQITFGEDAFGRIVIQHFAMMKLF